MRKKLIAGNWKMNLDLEESKALAKGIKDSLKDPKADVLVCPTFTNLSAVNDVIKDSAIELGAQNLYWEEKGAFTGEISPDMIKSVGCSYVIIGHSERRKFFDETDETVNLKIKSALAHGLKAILCIGETLEQRESGDCQNVVEAQLKNGLKDVSDTKDITIAYEPLWAISGGDPNHKAATPEDGQEVHEFIRNKLSEMYSEDVAKETRILYGGSAKPSNAKDILSMPDIDGALVGGASLTAEDFLKIIEAVD